MARPQVRERVLDNNQVTRQDVTPYPHNNGGIQGGNSEGNSGEFRTDGSGEFRTGEFRTVLPRPEEAPPRKPLRYACHGNTVKLSLFDKGLVPPPGTSLIATTE